MIANEHDESQSNSCGTASEDDEVIKENDILKNIQLVEAFKGQLSVFVGDASKEEFVENHDNDSDENKKTLKCIPKKPKKSQRQLLLDVKYVENISRKENT